MSDDGAVWLAEWGEPCARRRRAVSHQALMQAVCRELTGSGSPDAVRAWRASRLDLAQYRTLTATDAYATIRGKP